ncbi:MAG: type II toxin-antitoxin system VapC family toxin [Oscillospiraceae bacterium]|nr:type II toxin-antitoxin system VapC family toxin [Oscillospiraceae bacterium]
MTHYVLDACALIALLHNETGSDKVTIVFNNAFMGKVTITMNILNLLEVYYDAYRLYGKEQANLLLTELKKRPIFIEREITDEVFREAGRLKACYKISLADSIALAEALVSGGLLLTADHHEFDTVEKIENIRFLWIR